jgi:hypothetical protein
VGCLGERGFTSESAVEENISVFNILSENWTNGALKIFRHLVVRSYLDPLSLLCILGLVVVAADDCGV